MTYRTTYRTTWSASNGFWYIMRHRDGNLVVVGDNLHDLAIAQGSMDLVEEEIELTEEEAKKLGLDR